MNVRRKSRNLQLVVVGVPVMKVPVDFDELSFLFVHLVLQARWYMLRHLLRYSELNFSLDQTLNLVCNCEGQSVTES
jgi:hypothetical protein